MKYTSFLDDFINQCFNEVNYANALRQFYINNYHDAGTKRYHHHKRKQVIFIMKDILLFIKLLFRNILKPMSFLPAIIVMFMIFQFSAQDGATSADLSYKISHKLVQLADEHLDLSLSAEEINTYADRIHYYVRKTAHVTEYFILAATIAFPLYVYKLRGIPLVLVATIFCVGFAALDEYHQSFVAGRGAAIKDVCIDSIGILPGIYVVRIMGFIGRKTIFRPLAFHNS